MGRLPWHVKAEARTCMMRYAANSGTRTGEPDGVALPALVRPWRMTSLRGHRRTLGAAAKIAIAERSRRMAAGIRGPLPDGHYPRPRASRLGRLVRGLR